MAESQRNDVEDEVEQTNKTAEDRKAQAAMASMDARDDDANTNVVDKEAASQAIISLGAPAATDKNKEVKKVVKVDAADVALLVDELELTKIKVTELLKANDGDAVQAMKAFIAV